MARNQVANLQKLSDSPDDQSKEAIKLLKSSKNVAVIDACLDVLKQNPNPAARVPLLEIYDQYETKQLGNDRSGLMRAKLLEVLDPLLESEDISLLEQAALTFEIVSKNRDEAQALRSKALIVLSRHDPILAGFLSIRLLSDKYTSEMSGEPALTAIRVLADQNNFLPLYYYVLHSSMPNPEVFSECLTNLPQLPHSLKLGLLENYSNTDDYSLMSIIDYVVPLGNFEQIKAFLSNLLRNTERLNIFRYLATVLVTSRDEIFVSFLLDYILQEKNRGKLDILSDVLHETEPILRGVHGLDDELLSNAIQKLDKYG